MHGWQVVVDVVEGEQVSQVEVPDAEPPKVSWRMDWPWPCFRCHVVNWPPDRACRKCGESPSLEQLALSWAEHSSPSITL